MGGEDLGDVVCSRFWGSSPPLLDKGRVSLEWGNDDSTVCNISRAYLMSKEKAELLVSLFQDIFATKKQTSIGIPPKRASKLRGPHHFDLGTEKIPPNTAENMSNTNTDNNRQEGGGLLGSLTSGLDNTLTGGDKAQGQGGLLGGITGLVGKTTEGVGNVTDRTLNTVGGVVGQTTDTAGNIVGGTPEQIGTVSETEREKKYT
jgi:hypothetical protein